MSPEARERSFDELARGLGSGELSRRKALRLMGAALLGGTLASVVGIGEASADPPVCRRNGEPCRRDRQCCSGDCSSHGRCVGLPGSGPCNPCCGPCSRCTRNSDCCSARCVEFRTATRSFTACGGGGMCTRPL